MDFHIMSGDIIVGRWEKEAFTLIDKALAPLYLVNTGNVERWLETRAIDHHRANSRLLKKALRLTEKDDISTVISVHAATITDNYWIKPFGSALNYNDVRFDNDYFAGLALRGDYDSFNKSAYSKTTKTPELTNTGSFEKCWKLKKNDWWMVKVADHKQLFSEIFIHELGKRLGFNMVEYFRGQKCVMTRDFTGNGKYNFEPAFSFMGDNEDYIAVIIKLREVAPQAIADYVRMVFLDTIVANPDRHTFNFGLLREAVTGKILSLAPNFDNNMALISRGYPLSSLRKNDVLVKCFNELMEFDPELKQYVPSLMEDEIKAALAKVNMKVKADFVAKFIMNAYKQIDGAI